MKSTVMHNIPISAMTLGTVQLGLNYGINNKSGMPTEAKSFEILDTARESGVTVLDTSNDYGESEAVIGRYLRAYGDKPLSVCTKFRLDQETRSPFRSSPYHGSAAYSPRRSYSPEWSADKRRHNGRPHF